MANLNLPSSMIDKLLQVRGGAVSLGGISAMPFSLSQLKLVLQFLITGLNVLCWSFPIGNKVLKGNTRLLSRANCFAGGIFLMLSFGHLIPESISSLANHGSGDGYHGLLYVIAGFLAMLFVGKVAFHHDDDEHNLVEDHSKVPENGRKATGFSINSAMILCFAMSIHSFFESAALGMAKDVSSASLMSACIALHQPAESLALVVAFLKSGMSKSSIIAWLSGFSLVALAGNLTGMFINARASESMEAIIVAMTAGTFIYVGAAEIVGEEFEDSRLGTRVSNFLAYVLGMVTMYGVTSLVSKWENGLH